MIAFLQFDFQYGFRRNNYTALSLRYLVNEIKLYCVKMGKHLKYF